MKNQRFHPSAVLSAVLLLQTVPALPFFTGAALAESLQERQTLVLEVVKKVSPAVVAISGSSGAGRLGSGSGVIVSKDGLILTAGHVLAATGDELEITLPDGREVKAKALGRDMNRDAALAQITEPGEWPFVEMAKPESVERGEWVLAMGHPGGYDVSRGAPLRAGRLWEADTKAYFRSDCTVSGGDSGGPLFDLEGRVVGIHSSISQNLTENRHVPIGVFEKEMQRMKKGDRWGKLSSLMPEMRDLDQAQEADKEDDANEPQELQRPEPRQGPRRFFPRKERQTPPAEAPDSAPSSAGRPRLGVTLDPAPDGSGALVVAVADGSPAEKAGLQLEDVILKLNGNPVNRTADVVSAVEAAKPGDKLDLTISRSGKEQQLSVTLGTAP